MTGEGKWGKASVEEYLAYDASIEGKAEYYGGEIFERAGGSPDHSLISMNFGGAMGEQLRGSGCRVYSSDLRIFIPEDLAFVYPDLAVICGQREVTSIDGLSVLNPVVVVEVLSPSTAAFDRTWKFQRYATLPSLKEYVLVEQTTAMVHVFLRTPENKWLLSGYYSLDKEVRLESLQFSVPMAYIYEGVELVYRA